MALKILRFLGLLALALTLGMAFCHAMELPGKLRLSGADWLAVQHNLYMTFGPLLGAWIEIASILLAWIAAVALRRRHPAFGWTLAAAVLASAALGTWFVLVAPMNATLAGWTAEALPESWTAVRDQWEMGHAIRAGLFALAFSSLAVGLLSETPRHR